MKKDSSQKLHTLLFVSVIVILSLSFINPYNRTVWFLEVFPVIAGLIILFLTYKSFRLTNLSCWIIFIHCLILIWGGYHTYSRNPLFEYFKETFDLSRNHYDRLGHFIQGVTPAILSREILIRKGVLKDNGWMFFISVTISLAISAFYEFIEWWIAILSEKEAHEFLATQGDIWDTQWDMFLAMLGAIFTNVFLRKLHRNELQRLN